MGYKIYSLYAYVEHIDSANKAWLKGHKRYRNTIHGQWYQQDTRNHKSCF
jgi:hypothetical protein